MGILDVTGSGYGIEKGQRSLEPTDILIGGDYFVDEGMGKYTFKAYTESGDDKGMVTVTLPWLKANTKVSSEERKDSFKEQVLFAELKGPEHRRARSRVTEKKQDDPPKKTPPKRSTESKKKRAAPKQSPKKEPEDRDEDRKKIRGRRTGSNTNSQVSQVDCPEDPVGQGKKRKAEKAFGETENQIAFLKGYAKQRKGCTCFSGDDVSETAADTYETLEEATRAVYTILCKAKEKNNGKKPQKCDAFTILRRKGRYRILVTNSSAACVKPQTNSDTGPKKQRLSSVRPFKEPELSSNVTFGGMRCYAFNSCSVCQDEKIKNSAVIMNPEKNDDLDLTPLDDIKTNTMSGERIDNSTLNGFATKLGKRRVGKKGSHRLLFVSNIQPNENPQTTQQGWTLHHSEMEALIYAKRRGWTVVRMYIDRDCCKVCGATLGDMAPDVHDRIVIIDWAKVCKEVTPPDYEEPDSDREDEGEVQQKKKRRKVTPKEDEDEREEKGEEKKYKEEEKKDAVMNEDEEFWLQDGGEEKSEDKDEEFEAPAEEYFDEFGDNEDLYNDEKSEEF